MKWISSKENPPVTGQYVFLGKGDSIVVSVFMGEQGFVFFRDEDKTAEIDEYALVFLKGRYEPRPNTRGELDWLLEGVYDEDGNEYLD